MSDLRHVAVLIWLLPWIGVPVAYAVSVAGGHLEACVPHLTGCESVSATGRYGWGFFVFKAVMLPAAGLTVVYWLLCHHWLETLAAGARAHRVILTLGLTGTLSLVLYTTFLGSEGDVYRLLRRYGTVAYFGLTYLAQLLLTQRLRVLAVPSAVVPVKAWLGAGMLASGLLLGALANLVEDDDVFENVSEWLFVSALTGYPFLTWLIWRGTGFRITFHTG